MFSHLSCQLVALQLLYFQRADPSACCDSTSVFSVNWLVSLLLPGLPNSANCPVSLLLQRVDVSAYCLLVQ